jgi:hypothetical protein
MTLVPVPRRWTADYAARLFHDFECSSLSMAAFARQRGFHPQRLQRWRARLERRKQSPRVVELVSIAPTTSPGIGSVRVTCPSGHVVEVSGVEPVTVLVTTVRALREMEC